MTNTKLSRPHWSDPADCIVAPDFLAACNGDRLIAEILSRRGFNQAERIRSFFIPELYTPALPDQLPALETASQLLREAANQQKHVLVWGDFDVDGQTATALLVDALGRLGIKVTYFIPDRTINSHGIKLPTFKEQISKHKPDLVITCDTGISEFEALNYADSIGLPVIITDHHELAETIPPASAVINPRLLDRHHPLASLPGVGVAYKLIQHIYSTLGREREIEPLLDLVALGIVGDVAHQTHDTRYLLQLGLDRLRRTERIGLLALMEVANLTPANLTGERIAYQIAPRLNAAGRLSDASLSVELLTTTDWTRARVLAQQLEGLNNERRVQTKQIEAAAEAMIAASPTLLESNALVLYQPEWHPGIIGIVASHLADRYGRPVVMLAGQENNIARGSARAPSGYDINKALIAVADLLRTYGGHPGAAGLSLYIEHIDRFRGRFSEALASMGVVGPRPLVVDAAITLDQITLDLVNRLLRLAPFGEGNPQIVLMTQAVKLSHATIVGRDAVHRRLTVEDRTGRQQVVLWWHSSTETLPDGVFDLAYNLNINERQEVQLSLVDFRLRPDETPVDDTVPIEVLDWRNAHNPTDKLSALCADSESYVVWAEAASRSDHPEWKRRAELTPAEELIIFTVPSDPQTLHDVIAQVQPTKIHVFGMHPPIARVQPFLTQLERAVQNVLEHLKGETSLDVLCGAVAGSPQVVRAGLSYLAAEGKFSVTFAGKQQKIVRLTADSAAVDSAAALARVEAAFEEMIAYRRYYSHAPIENLITM
jgi:single-stranded-DNA-specific exonuclease